LKLRTRLRWVVFWAALVLIVGLAWNWWRERRYDGLILAAAHRYRVDPALVKAVIWQESGFFADSHGSKGEMGLMQIRDAAASEWAAAEHVTPFDHNAFWNPATNILAGTWYLNKLLQRYQETDNAAAYALADYNAGRGNVLKWIHGAAATNSAAFLTQMDFPGTRIYVRGILGRAERYRPM
jgi:soluble lytic murein transglycosylase